VKSVTSVVRPAGSVTNWFGCGSLRRTALPNLPATRPKFRWSSVSWTFASSSTM
jgi:hypothetical protein